MPKPDDSVMDGLFQLSFLLQATLTRIAAEHQLSVVQIRLLAILRDREPGMLELARHLDLKKSSLSGLVDRAEKRGLVERIPSANDRRAATIRVTSQGRKLSSMIAGSVNAAVNALVQEWSAADRKKLAALAGRMLRESDTNPQAK